MISSEQLKEVALLVEQKSFSKGMHIDFTIVITGYGRQHMCSSESSARNNEHRECKESCDFKIIYEVYSGQQGAPMLQDFSSVDEAIECLRGL